MFKNSVTYSVMCNVCDCIILGGFYFRNIFCEVYFGVCFVPLLFELLLILFNIRVLYFVWRTAVAQWLRCCATNRKVVGSIPAGVSGFFIDIKSFRSHYGPGVDSTSNRNEYQKYLLGVKAAGA